MMSNFFIKNLFIFNKRIFEKDQDIKNQEKELELLENWLKDLIENNKKKSRENIQKLFNLNKKKDNL